MYGKDTGPCVINETSIKGKQHWKGGTRTKITKKSEGCDVANKSLL